MYRKQSVRSGHPQGTPLALPMKLACLAALGSLGTAMPAWGANECQVEYGYHEMSGITRTDRTATVNLDLGESKSYDQGRMNFVKNKKSTQLKVRLQGAHQNNFTLPANGVNPAPPAPPFYLTPVKLKKLECLAESPNQLAQVMKQANKTAAQVAQALKDMFSLTGAQVAAQLQLVGYSAAQTVAALKLVFNATLTQAAQWAQAAGYAGEQVAAALKAAFDANATAAASALKAVYNASASVMTGWLQAAGYAGAQVAAALQGVYNVTATVAGQALKTAYNVGGAVLAGWLHAANYGGQQIAAALKLIYNGTATQLALWLKSSIDGSAHQMAQWLHATGYTLQQIAAALVEVDYQPGDIVKALKALNNATAAQVIAVLHNFGAPFNSCAAVCTVAQLLKDAGYSPGDALAALRTHYQLTVQAAEGLARTVWVVSVSGMSAVLSAAGYSAAQIASVLEAGANSQMALSHVVHGIERACGRIPSGTVYGSTHPVPLPPTGRPVTYTFGGQSLASVNGLSGLPSGVAFRLVESAPCYAVFVLTAPTHLREGMQGQARLRAGQAQGPGFSWRVGTEPGRNGLTAVQPGGQQAISQPPIPYPPR